MTLSRAITQVPPKFSSVDTSLLSVSGGFSAARGQQGADGSGSVLCQQSLSAVWPSSNPPATKEEDGGANRQLEEGSFKPSPCRAIHKHKISVCFYNLVLRMNLCREGFPVQPSHTIQCTEAKESCQDSTAKPQRGGDTPPASTATCTLLRSKTSSPNQTYLCKVIHLLQAKGNNWGLKLSPCSSL